jgi:predicted double-glycine peptidase
MKRSRRAMLRARWFERTDRGIGLAGTAVFFALCAVALPVHSQPPVPSDRGAPTASDTRELRVASMRELRDRGVVRQQRDYSCGAAALATVLTFGLNEPTSEESILRAVFEPLSGDQLIELQKNGLSLRHLQQVAEQRGFKAQGFRLGTDQLEKLQRPVIVFIRPGGYRHFAVLKGVRDGRAYLADPSLGNVRMPLTRFVEQWADAADPAERGVIFAVERADATWPAHYGLQIDPGPLPPLETGAALRLTDPTSTATRLTPIR